MADNNKTKVQLIAEIERLRQLAVVVQDSNDAITAMDYEGNFTAWNQGAVLMYGYTEAEAVQMNVRALTPDTKLAELLTLFEALKSEKPKKSFETTRVTKDGKSLDVWLTVTRILDHDLQPWRIATTERDVTERNELQKNALQEKDEWYKTTLSSLGDAVIATDKLGDVTFMNGVAERLTGWTEDSAIGTPLSDVFHIVNDLTRKRSESPVEKVLRTNGVVGLANHTILIARNGTEYFIDDSGAPIRNTDKEIVGIVLVFRDITEKRSLEMQLIQSQKMEAIGTLAGGIAHDFNNLLSPIMGFAELLKMSLPGDSEEYSYADNIVISSKIARELVANILRITRSSLEKTESVQVKTLASEVLTVLRASTEPLISLRQDFDFDVPHISADPSQIYQLLLNVCTNAIHAVGSKGEVQIKLDVVDHHRTFHDHPSNVPLLCISVQDNGCGMDANTLIHVYEPFFTTTQKGTRRGTGLGMSIVANIVKNHNGHIEIESALGVGSTVRIYLPTIVGLSQDEGDQDLNVERDGRNISILLVDDDSMVNDVGTACLKTLGHTVHSYTDSLLALEKFASTPNNYDLLISDYTMPLLSGPELIKAVKAIRSDIPVLVMTGHTALATPENMEHWGVDGFIKKPFSILDIDQAITSALAEDGDL